MNRKTGYPYIRQWSSRNQHQPLYPETDNRILPFIAGALIAAPLWGMGRNQSYLPYPYPYPYPYPPMYSPYGMPYYGGYYMFGPRRQQKYFN